MTQGLDFAWGWPGDRQGIADFIRAIQEGGYEFVFRYLSTDDSKNLHHAEAKALSDAGIWIGVVWETTATRAGDGYGAGRSDAKAAELQAQACGMPAGRPIYFAVDYDAAGSDVEQYFHGVASVLTPERAGVYGGIRVVAYLLDAGLVHYAWQASAWSAGQWDPRAHVRQYEQRTVGGVDCDVNTARKPDFGQWRIGVTPQPQQQEDDMPQGQLNRDGKKNTPISIPAGKYTALGFAADNGLLGHPAVALRVAQRVGRDNWHIDHVKVDSAADKTTVKLDAKADEVSVTYEDDGVVPVGWDMS